MLSWGLLPLAALAALPVAAEALRKPMDAEARRAAPGAFARLSGGVTHYRWDGPEDGPLVICVHGLTTPSFVWRDLAAGLAAAGFRVLSYDLYGRGYSDRPRGAQTSAFFLRQLDELLADQKVTQPAALVGYSMGGIIATAFATARPAMTQSLVLLAPAGLQPLGTGTLGRLIGIPLLGRWTMLARYPAILRRGLEAEAGRPRAVPEVNRLQRAELGYRGFVAAVHESLRGILREDVRPLHGDLHAAGIPVLAIWGGQDAVIPLSTRDRLQDSNPTARHHVIEDAGHGLPYTHSAEVLPQVVPFLEGTR